MTDVEKLIESVKCEALVLTDQAELVSALRRLAAAEKVFEEIRRTKGMTNHPMALKYIRDALSAYDATAKEAQ